MNIWADLVFLRVLSNRGKQVLSKRQIKSPLTLWPSIFSWIGRHILQTSQWKKFSAPPMRHIPQPWQWYCCLSASSKRLQIRQVYCNRWGSFTIYFIQKSKRNANLLPQNITMVLTRVKCNAFLRCHMYFITVLNSSLRDFKTLVISPCICMVCTVVLSPISGVLRKYYIIYT